MDLFIKIALALALILTILLHVAVFFQLSDLSANMREFLNREGNGRHASEEG